MFQGGAARACGDEGGGGGVELHAKLSLGGGEEAETATVWDGLGARSLSLKPRKLQGPLKTQQSPLAAIYLRSAWSRLDDWEKLVLASALVERGDGEDVADLLWLAAEPLGKPSATVSVEERPLLLLSHLSLWTLTASTLLRDKKTN